MSQPLADENQPKDDFVKMFGTIRIHLDSKQDKIERIVTLGRSMTFQSKRIIFLLHRMSTNKDALDIAESKLRNVRDQANSNIVLKLAKELESEDFWMYLRCYTAGIQEYIEALALWKYLKFGKLINLEEAQSFLRVDDEDESLLQNEKAGAQTEQVTKCRESRLQVPLPPTDFFLGIADFTGELMRACVAAVAEGDKAFAFKACFMVQEIYRHMCGLSYLRRDIQLKQQALKSSVLKMENACYHLTIRDCYEAAKPLAWNEYEHEQGYESGGD